jgi:hypothetical protein
MTFTGFLSLVLLLMAAIGGTLFLIGLCRMNDDLDHDREIDE